MAAPGRRRRLRNLGLRAPLGIHQPVDRGDLGLGTAPSLGTGCGLLLGARGRRCGLIDRLDRGAGLGHGLLTVVFGLGLDRFGTGGDRAGRGCRRLSRCLGSGKLGQPLAFDARRFLATGRLGGSFLLTIS